MRACICAGYSLVDPTIRRLPERPERRKAAADGTGRLRSRSPAEIRRSVSLCRAATRHDDVTLLFGRRANRAAAAAAAALSRRRAAAE